MFTVYAPADNTFIVSDSNINGLVSTHIALHFLGLDESSHYNIEIEDSMCSLLSDMDKVKNEHIVVYCLGTKLPCNVISELFESYHNLTLITLSGKLTDIDDYLTSDVKLFSEQINSCKYSFYYSKRYTTPLLTWCYFEPLSHIGTYGLNWRVGYDNSSFVAKLYNKIPKWLIYIDDACSDIFTYIETAKFMNKFTNTIKSLGDLNKYFPIDIMSFTSDNNISNESTNKFIKG